MFHNFWRNALDTYGWIEHPLPRIEPKRPYKQLAHKHVARLGDTACANLVSSGVLAGKKANIELKGPRVREAGEVAYLDGDGKGGKVDMPFMQERQATMRDHRSLLASSSTSLRIQSVLSVAVRTPASSSSNTALSSAVSNLRVQIQFMCLRV